MSASIFSGRWAEILTTAVVDAPPDPSDRAALAAWPTPLRQAWAESIDATRLTWFQKAKLKLGAFSTLLWAEPRTTGKPGWRQPGEYRLRSFAIGDSCLFLLRDGRLLRSFPIEDVERVQADPLVIGSLDLGRDDRLAFVRGRDLPGRRPARPLHRCRRRLEFSSGSSRDCRRRGRSFGRSATRPGSRKSSGLCP